MPDHDSNDLIPQFMDEKNITMICCTKSYMKSFNIKSDVMTLVVCKKLHALTLRRKENGLLKEAGCRLAINLMVTAGVMTKSLISSTTREKS